MLLLDTFRVKRNAIDYSGSAVDEVSVATCIEATEYLLSFLKVWISKTSPI